MTDEVIDEVVLPVVVLEAEREEPFVPRTTLTTYDETVRAWELPPEVVYEDIPTFRPEKRSLVIDIETTAQMPYDGIVFSIGVKDAAQPDAAPTVFMHEDEKVLLQEFCDWYVAGGFNELIGYNVSFDLRYLFADMMRHRIKCPELLNSDLYDIMQIMKQVKPEFVFGFNKPGKLEDWAFYLFGIEKTMDYATLKKAMEEKNYDLVREYNSNDVDITFKLWSLIQFAYGKTELIPAAAPVTESSNNPVGNKEVQCERCFANNTVKEGTTEFTCSNCGAINKL